MIEKAQEKYALIIEDVIKKELKHIKENWFLILVCFFISRQNIIDKVFPFAIVVLSSYCHIKGPWISILIVTIAGVLSVSMELTYVVMLAAVYAYFFNFRNEGQKSIFLISGYSAAVLFFSKAAMLMANGFNVNGLMLSIFEALFIFSAIILISEGKNTIIKIRKGTVKRPKIKEDKEIGNIEINKVTSNLGILKCLRTKDKEIKDKEIKDKWTKDRDIRTNIEKFSEIKGETAKKEAASTISDTNELIKNKAKNKYLNIFSANAKQKIKEQLLWQNITLKFFEVISSGKSSVLLSITVKTEKTAEETEATITLIVRNICGVKVRCTERISMPPNYYVFKFKNIKKVKIRTYTSSAIKDGSNLSGDNFAYAGRADKYYTVLCDGIGSGEDAFNESSSAVELMSRFLYTDFTEEQILRTLNSVLMIKLGEERYVTFDFAIIDYGTKELRLYKAGASPSFIISGKSVDKISAKSLPLGILDNFEYSSFKKEINIGDMVVMVTDGIIDSINQDTKKDLDKYLVTIAERDPQTIANSILSYALRGRDSIIDDMTVLVTKIG